MGNKPSIYESLSGQFRKPTDLTYKQAWNAAATEAFAELRSQLQDYKQFADRQAEIQRDQRDMLAIARSQIEQLQGGNRRLAEQNERAERNLLTVIERLEKLERLALPEPPSNGNGSKFTPDPAKLRPNVVEDDPPSESRNKGA